MVEGGKRENDHAFSRSIRVRKNIASRNPHNSISVGLKESISRLVKRRAVAPIMSFSIDFDDQLRGRTIEIHHVGINRMLLAESRT